MFCLMLLVIWFFQMDMMMKKLMFLTLYTRVIKPNTKISNPKVNILLNEFIIDDILHEPLDNRKFDYYQILLLYDANEILIDCKQIVLFSY